GRCCALAGTEAGRGQSKNRAPRVTFEHKLRIKNVAPGVWSGKTIPRRAAVAGCDVQSDRFVRGESGCNDDHNFADRVIVLVGADERSVIQSSGGRGLLVLRDDQLAA